KWLDDQGGIHFTDNYDSIPEKYRTKNKVTVEEKQSSKKGETGPAQEPGASQGTTESPTGSRRSPVVKVDKNGHDEDWWHQRFKENKDKQLQLFKDKAKLEVNYQELSKRYNNPAFGGRGRKALAPEVEELQKKIKDLDEAIKETKEALEKTLPEEAQKAEAPTEWLR
ncbi:MAG: hypothetical protein HY730_07260, partial [Candidatus Tectomicrobia bacterium]|nr:hypothetical protein [Candidatus Tectomicrobia bacterium]